MDICFTKISDYKRKFARLLSELYFNAHIELDNISSKMISSSFLDFIEGQTMDDFMNMENSKYIETLFPEASLSEAPINDIGPIYWSGIQYMNIFLNYRIPLKTIFLLCPLKKMVNKFEIYHEMNEIELCKDFIKDEYKNASILRIFRVKKSLSIRELSILSGVSEATIRYLELDNANIFKTSNEILNPIKKVLNIDEIFFQRKSSFLPITYFTLTNPEFVKYLKDVLNAFYLKELKDIVVKFDGDIETDKDYLLLGVKPYLRINKKDTYLDHHVLDNLLSLCLDKYLLENNKVNLTF